MQQPSRLPQQIRVTQLGGLDERVSPSQLKPGEFSVLEGLYPAKNGQLSRVPGKTLLATLPGGTNILQITQTFNPTDDVLVQTDMGRIAFTVAELRGRQTIPNLTPGTTPGTNVEEESMSIAIIEQREVNAQTGGSIQGFLSGTDSSSAANTFYGRRLTDLVQNQSSTVVSFTASTGGSGVASTPGQWVLAPGAYRIRARATFGANGANLLSAVIGLYNVTNTQFQNHAGGSIPILGTPQASLVSAAVNLDCWIEGRFTVTGSNNTFQLFQECASTAQARALNFGGYNPTLATANVNGSAPKNVYTTITILKEP